MARRPQLTLAHVEVDEGTLDAGARCAGMFFFFSSRAGIGGSILISLLLSLLLLYACSA